MNEQRLTSLLHEVFACPTAPFHEHHVRDKILELLEPLEHVSVSSDEFGNLIACYRRGEDAQPKIAFGAHMDHPGWVREADSEQVTFLGGVPESYRDREKNPVRWFDDGAFGMWDLPECEIRDGLIAGRVCDDLIGCVAMIAMLENLEVGEVEASCYTLFTRAEEVGFVGAVHLAKNWPLGSEVRFVSLETSSPRGDARLGDGPVVRVGDRMTVFDDEVTGELLEAAKFGDIPVQRCLLDGGSCEATAMQLYGVVAAGISVLLNDYHNCGEDELIVSESVSFDDVMGLVKLITALVERMASADAGPSAREAMKSRIEERLEEHQTYADATRENFIARSQLP